MRLRTSPRGTRSPLLALALLLATAVAAPAQFIPYYGKNKVKYDNFSWRIYKSPHFEVYYYPEFEQHLERLTAYLETSYQKVSSELKHEIPFAIPVMMYKTHSEFEQTNLFPSFVPEGVLAFAEPVRDRMVLPIDLPPDELQGLITHELTHIFEFDLIPRGLIQRGVPLWVDEGLADYVRGTWDPLDLMMVRDAAVADQIPRMTRSDDLSMFGNVRLTYNMGHAVFEYIEDTYGKEGIRQFIYTLRKNVVGARAESIYQQAFRVRPEEFDKGFEKWMKERFKPYRDKERPDDYGLDLAPDPERTSFIGVYGFSPSPSGEVVAALTGNRSEGEIDVVLLSSRDGGVVRNLTAGFTGRYEHITLGEDFVAGRSLDFSPRGDVVAFFARSGKRRSLYLVSALTGGVVADYPMTLDQAASPSITPDGRHVLFSALDEGVSDIFAMDLETGETRNLTRDDFADSNPRVSPDGTLVAYNRRISGSEKVLLFPITKPELKTQITFGPHDDAAPFFSSDGTKIFYSSNEDDDIYNVRSLDLETGVVRQYTDALGGNMAPAPLAGGYGDSDRVAFVSYAKGSYGLSAISTEEPLREVDQPVELAAAEILDYQPDVPHRVVPENKRRKGMFEGLYLEGRPPLNIGVTSSGDFYGGTQIALTDVLGDQNFVFTALSLREYRSYSAEWMNLAGRFQYGINLFDATLFFYDRFFIPSFSYDLRDGLLLTQRFSGASLQGVYPLDKFRRLRVSASVMNIRERFDNPELQAQHEFLVEQGLRTPLRDGWALPLEAYLIQETTRFSEFGPLSGSTFMIGGGVAPGGELGYQTVEADLRKYFRLGSTTSLLAFRGRGFYSRGDFPEINYFGGNMEMRGFPYYSFAGNQGFHVNAELRTPLIHIAATPLGIIGPVRGTVFFNMGAARYADYEDYQFSSSDAGISYVNYPGDQECLLDNPLNPLCDGEPVEGFHLVDGRASYGFGLQVFFLGYPLHFDWVKLTDLQVTSRDYKFHFWVGYDF